MANVSVTTTWNSFLMEFYISSITHQSYGFPGVHLYNQAEPPYIQTEINGGTILVKSLYQNTLNSLDSKDKACEQLH